MMSRNPVIEKDDVTKAAEFMFPKFLFLYHIFLFILIICTACLCTLL